MISWRSVELSEARLVMAYQQELGITKQGWHTRLPIMTYKSIKTKEDERQSIKCLIHQRRRWLALLN